MNYDSGLSASDVALINGRNSDGFGDGNGWWIILFLIVLFGGWGNRGFGGFGGNGNDSNGRTSVYEGYVLNNDFSVLSKSMSDYYSMTERKLDGINNGLCSGFYQEAQLINGVNSNIANAQYNLANAITTNGYETRNAITQDTIANMQNANALQAQIAQCCCDNKLAIAGVNSNIQGVNTSIAMQTNALQNAMCINTRDIIDNQNANYRALHDEIIANRIEDKNAQIAALQVQLNNAELRASQENQTREIVNTIRPCPIPAYQSCNPWGCNCNQGCGCNC